MECSILESNSIENSENCDVSKIINEINLKKCEITSVLVKLKDHLTSSDQEKRANGMHILSSILKELKTDFCSQDEIKCLSEYFAARLSDKSLVIEKSVDGLVSLCHFENYDFQLASSLFFTIQNEQPISLLKPDYKFKIYQLIQYLFRRFQSDFVNLGANFVYGFLRIVDSETSPTCLTVIFEMFEEISKIPQFESHLEDIFDSMACYFPIIYSSDKKDKYFETKVLLSGLLNKSMTATNKYSKYVIQISLEKLESESKESKISCYRLLQMAFPKYTCEDVKEFLSEIWVSIRIDTLKPKIENDDLADNALAALSKLSAVISNDEECCKNLMNKIWNDLEISMKSPELELTYSSVKILIAFASTNSDIFHQIFQRLHPILLHNFVFHSDLNVQKTCLESFYKIVEHSRIIKVNLQETESSKQISLLMENSPNKPNEIRRLIILIMNEYVQICTIDNKDFLLMMIYYAMNSVEQSGYEITLKEACFEFITNISTIYSHLIYEIFLKPTMDDIDAFDMIDEKRIIFLLEILKFSCSTVKITINVIDFLINRLMIFKNSLNDEIHHNIATNIMEIFEFILKKFHCDLQFMDYFHHKCIMKLLKIFTQLCYLENLNNPSIELVEQFAQLFHNYLSYAQLIDQNICQKTTKQILKAFLEKDVSNLLENSPISSSIPVNLSNNMQVEFIFLLIYSCLKSQSKIEFQFPELLIEVYNQIDTIILSDSEKILKISSMIKSQIILKLIQINSNEIENLLQKNLIYLKQIKNEEFSNESERNIFQINFSIWINKSLFKMKHQMAVSYSEAILDCIDCHNELIRKSISKIVDIIYSQDDFWQTIYSNEVLMPLDRQFSTDLHQLICEKFSSKIKNNNNDPILLYILLSHLKFMPKSLINIQDNQFIFKGLELQSNEYQEVNILSLTFLQNILQTNPDLIEPQVITVLRSLIEMAKKNRSLVVRKKSLDLITMMIDLFGECHFLKLRNQFVQDLKSTLADHKRIVRSSAVKSFFKMCILGQPGNKRKW